jgi:hypothetical protein
MRSGLGRLMILMTLFIIPFGICVFVLVSVFPAFKAEWLSLRWIAATVVQCVLIVAVGTTGILLVQQAYSTMAMLSRVEGGGTTGNAGLEDLG